MSRRSRPWVHRLESRETPAVITWIAVNDPPHLTTGSWHDPANWSGGKVPGVDDTAVFPGEPMTGNRLNCQITAPVTVGGIEFTGDWIRDLIIADSLTTTGASSMTRADIIASGAGVWINDGTLTIQGTTPKFFQGAFVNNGTIAHNTTNDWEIVNGSSFTNAKTGVYQFNSIGDWDWEVGLSPAPVFINQGTIHVNATTGDGLVYIEADFRNELGTITIQAGTLEIRAENILPGAASTGGTFNVAAIGTLKFVAGFNPTPGYTWQGTYTGSGPGTVELASGTLNLGTGATLNFPPSVLHWTGATITNGTLTNLGSMSLSGSTARMLSGTATLINQGMIRQSGTADLDIESKATLHNEAGGLYDFQTDADLDWINGFDAPTITNKGTIRKSTGSGVSTIQGNFSNQGGTLDVLTGTLLLDSSFASAVPVHTGGTFQVAPAATLDLTGSFTVTFEGSYTATGGGTILLNSGTLNAGAGGVFNFPAGMWHWTAGTLDGSLTNAGHVTLSGSAARTLAGTAKFTNSGTLLHNGTGDLDIVSLAQFTNTATGLVEFQTDADFDWVSGINAPIIINQGTIRKSAGTAVTTIQGKFENQGGTLDVQIGTLLLDSSFAGVNGVSTGGTFTVAPGAILDLIGSDEATYQGTYSATGGGTILLDGGTVRFGTGASFNFPAGMAQWNSGIWASGTLTNLGTLTIGSASNHFLGATLINEGTILHTGPGDLRFQNLGKLTNAATGTYDLTANANFSLVSGSATWTNNGLFRKSIATGTTSIASGVSVTNTGTIDLQAGTFNPPGTLDLGGGILRGTGNVTSSIINTGSVIPGNSPGTLTLSGNYTQTSAGQLIVEINGLLPGVDHDVLAVTGDVTLDGSLVVVPSFAFIVGDVFTILTNSGTDAIAGNFMGLAEGATLSAGGTDFKISYVGGTGNDVTLAVLATTAPRGVHNVIINNGAAQRSRVTELQVEFNQPVMLPPNPADAFVLVRQSDSSTVSLNATVMGNVATLTFAGGPVEFGSLADGRYTLTVLAAAVNGGNFDGNGDGILGDNYVRVGTPVNGLFRLFGDADGNGLVDTTDFLAFRLAFLSASPVFDSDGSGLVDAADFLRFRLAFLAQV